MDLRRSTVTTDDGWTWLAPARRGMQLRQAFWSAVLSLLLIGLAAAATLPPPVFAVPLVALVLGAGLWLARRLWLDAHSAVAVSPLGIAVRGAFDVAQIAWPAVDAVVGVPVGDRLRDAGVPTGDRLRDADVPSRGRLRIVVETRGVRHATAATFSREPALRWLEICAGHARRRHLSPRPLDDRPGFRTR